MRQVIDIQRIAHEAALGLHADFLGTNDREERARVASAISNLGKAWCSLQDAKREILGRPKAGVFKPERPKPKQKPYWEPLPFREAQLHSKPQEDDVQWEMREVRPGVSEQVVVDSPAIRAAAAVGGASPAGQPAAPPAAQPKQPAVVPCSMCGGKGTRRNSNFAIDLMCVTCKGTGREPGSQH